MLSPHASVAYPSSQASIRPPHHPCAGAPTARATALGIGCGFGLGSAWQQNQVSLVGQAVPCPCQAYHALPPVRLPSSLDEVDRSLLAMPQSAASMLDKLQCPHPRVPIRSGTLPLAVWQQCRQEVMHRRQRQGSLQSGSANVVPWPAVNAVAMVVRWLVHIVNTYPSRPLVDAHMNGIMLT